VKMSSQFRRADLAVVAAFAATALPALVQANPRPLPFSYPYETLPAQKFEIEQYADLVPVRVVRENPDGTSSGVFSLRSVLQTELEYGITDRLELGWYFVFQQGASAGTPVLGFDGIKQRLRLRLAEEGEWPLNVGLYLELAEFHDEFEVEEKILLSRRLGRLNLVANLWVEQEYAFQADETEFLYHPTLGATYEISPQVIVGAEYWARGAFGDPLTDARHYLGPTFLLQSGELWLSAGAYLRLDRLASNVELADPNGKVWFRAVIGIGL
jgi:hypothetical protein